jgi:hypothetical protein
MGPRLQKRSNLPRHAWAMGVAACAHLLALLLLGWRIPKIAAPEQAEDQGAAIEVTLVRPQARPPARSAPPSSGRASSAPSVSHRVLIAPTPSAPALSAPVQSPPSPQVAEGPPDCATEDLPLLTEAERARCRNAIDADNARRQARNQDQEAARRVAQAKSMPQYFRMGADKELYYDAVAAAYAQQSHGPPMAGRHPEVHCSAGKPPNSLKLGPLPCYVTPPQGFLTEESGIPRPY